MARRVDPLCEATRSVHCLAEDELTRAGPLRGNLSPGTQISAISELQLGTTDFYYPGEGDESFELVKMYCQTAGGRSRRRPRPCETSRRPSYVHALIHN
ncbi:hypothetical protein EVAR_38459_1 [Eumeta japonica]|uniref:Uncharacterized protein n=1 Tax=Eumeta variegata TaxID=151549 RepID=A0A4C1WMS2_EUMVA|nr:hypothetical protein EVAR_38459_1 [Eumeta japonica]